MRVVPVIDSPREVKFERIPKGNTFRFKLTNDVYMRVGNNPKEPQAVNIRNGTITNISSMTLLVQPVEGHFQEILT